MSAPDVAVSPFEEIWRRLRHPVASRAAAEALLGLGRPASKLMAATLLLTSEEADDLCDGMGRMVRSVSIATSDRPQRMVGEIRGPIMWSETVAARSASLHDPGLFVCATPERAYDTSENRVLAAALNALVRASDAVDASGGLSDRRSPLARHARHNADLARQYRDHRVLATVASRPTRRDLRRARTGPRRRTYGPAVALLERAGSPIRPDDVHMIADDDSRADAGLLAEVLRVADAAAGYVTTARCTGGVLHAGPVTYRHRHTDAAAPEGVSVAGSPVHTAADARRLIDAS